MYWFKSFAKSYNGGVIIVLSLAFTATMPACKPDIRETGGSMKYFDLKSYFKSDSARLSRQHPLITKTARHNGSAQTKKEYIDNWGREFEPFISSDINKPAWRQSYGLQTGNNITIYNALTPDLKTRELAIKQVNGKVKWILIRNHTKNMLFENTEELIYYPDSVYRITKSQHVLLMGKNLYAIKGVF